MPDLFSLPFGFYLSLAILAAVAAYAWKNRRQGWGFPAMAVCGTVLVWYHGDVVYNDSSAYSHQFSPTTIDAAWLQVALFLVCLAWLARRVNRVVNRRLTGRTSIIVGLLRDREGIVWLQPTLEMAFGILAFVWIGLSLIAMLRTDFDWRGVFAPWLGNLANPWGRGRLGAGFDFLLSAAGMVNQFCLAGFGVVAALALSRRMRIAAIGLILVSWPLVLFDRTRNTMLVAVLPGLLSLVFVRFQGRRVIQLSILVASFLAISSWFTFVLVHRSQGSVAGDFAASNFRARIVPSTRD